jgi:hypothetical protein
MNKKNGVDGLESSIRELRPFCSIAETSFRCWTLTPNTKSDEEFIRKLLNEARIEYRLI